MQNYRIDYSTALGVRRFAIGQFASAPSRDEALAFLRGQLLDVRLVDHVTALVGPTAPTPPLAPTPGGGPAPGWPPPPPASPAAPAPPRWSPTNSFWRTTPGVFLIVGVLLIVVVGIAAVVANSGGDKEQPWHSHDAMFAHLLSESEYTTMSEAQVDSLVANRYPERVCGWVDPATSTRGVLAASVLIDFDIGVEEANYLVASAVLSHCRQYEWILGN